MTRVLSISFKIVSSVLLLSVAGLFVFSLLPIPGNIQTKIVKSGSMEPAIHTGALVVIKPQGSYAVGDIITFGPDTAREIPTTHRVVEVLEGAGGPSYVTQGDANEEADTETVTQGNVIGRVLIDVSYVGFLLDFAKQPLGFVLLIALPAAVIIFDEIVSIWREITKRRRERNENSYDAT